MKILTELKINITITNPEVLEGYADVHEQLIIDDVINNPKAWLLDPYARIIVKKTWFED